MKTIIVKGWVLDNQGNYQAPGTRLSISKADRAECIDADRAGPLASVEAKRRSAKAAKTRARAPRKAASARRGKKAAPPPAAPAAIVDGAEETASSTD